MKTMALTLILTGNPLEGNDHWQVRTRVGDTAYVRYQGSVHETRFLTGPIGRSNNVREAVRAFLFPLSKEMCTTLPLVAFEGYAEPTNEQIALEELMTKATRAGIEMFIEWICNHPDLAVRQQFADTLTHETLTASFL